MGAAAKFIDAGLVEILKILMLPCQPPTPTSTHPTSIHITAIDDKPFGNSQVQAITAAIQLQVRLQHKEQLHFNVVQSP